MNLPAINISIELTFIVTIKLKLNWLFNSLLSPAGIYLLKVNNRNTRSRCEISSKLTIPTPERRQWRRSGIFNVNSEHISHLVLVFLLLILNMKLSPGSTPFNSKGLRASHQGVKNRCIWKRLSFKNIGSLQLSGWQPLKGLTFV